MTRAPLWFALVLALAAAAAPAHAEEPPAPVDALAPPPSPRRFQIRDHTSRARGPVEVREAWMLSQMRLTLPTTGPDLLPRGMTTVRAYANRGNDFGWNQTDTGEDPDLRRFLVDGEHGTLALEVEHGVAARWNVGIRVPVEWRGALFMDGIIDAFHNTTGGLDNLRRDFRNDRYRIEGILQDGTPFSWNDERGWGLGNLEVSARYALKAPCCRDDWRVTAIGRLGLPTGTGPFARDGIDVGAQIVAGKRVWSCVDLYGGLGGTWFSGTTIRTVEYLPLRWNAFFAVEWRPAHDWSFLAQLNNSSRLIDNIAGYPESQWYVRGAVKVDLNCRTQFEFGFTENIKSQQSTTDFGLFAGLVLTF